MHMWSLLQKLIRYLQGEEQGLPKTERLPAAPGQLQAKTKSIYPRERTVEQAETLTRRTRERRFRFPVIPDDPQSRTKREERPQPNRENRAAAVPKASQDQAFDKKQLYTPSEVYSPIYGKIEPGTGMSPGRTPRKEIPPVQQTAPLEELAQAETAAADERYVPLSTMESRPGPSSAAIMERAEEHQKPVQQLEPSLLQAAEEDPVPIWHQPVREPILPSAPFMPEEPEEAETALEPEKTEREAHPDTIGDGKPQPVTEPTALPIVHWSHPTSEEVAQVGPEPSRETYIPAAPLPRAVVEPDAGTAQSASYELPSLSLLKPSPRLSEDDDEYTLQQKQLLEETLANFHVNAQVVGIVKGPSVTRFELQPAPGVKVNKITGLIDDIKLNMAAKDIRIEAPIPGRNAVGIEVPNLKSEPIFISRIVGSEQFRNHPSPLAVALGMDIGGEPIVADIKKMPHGLIAGATGSGKSVCINSIIVSLLYKATPEQVRLLLIDPKMVELAPYNHLPHLVTPVVTDAKQATAALKWAVEEMEKRYALFVDAGVRDIDRYNLTTDEPLPYIVIVIDELADLMMVSPQDVEDCIIRIAQKARACGIHLLLATQRPSVDVITGNIKANVPTRLAFAVFSQVDSRTILDQSGAERLLGRGDMLFLESGAAPIRLQGNFVSDDEIEAVTSMIKKQRKPDYYFSKEELEQQVQSYDMGDDSLYHEALLFVAEQGQASASALQRRFRIGYNRAARLIEMMEAEGHVAGQSGGKPRAVLITREDAQALAEGSTLL